MKSLLVISLLLAMVSCSSVKPTGDTEADALIAHMAKGERVIGKDWEPKFLKDGFVNGEYIAIGSTISRDIDYLRKPLTVNAEAEATARLLRSAPSDFKKIVQRVINTLDGDEGSTQESQIMVTEVKSLVGMKSNFDDQQCVTTAVPNQDLKYHFVKECRVIVRVPASNLAKAYDYTLEKKYSIIRKNDIEKMLQQEFFSPTATLPVAPSVPVQANIDTVKQ